MSMFTSSIRAILKKYKPVVAQTVKETEGRDYVTSGDMINFAVRSAFNKLRDSPLNRGPALAEQKRLSELQAAQRQADYIQRTRDLVNPVL